METTNTLTIIAGILLIPLIPSFVIYKFLPSNTVVNGPFKGLNINLTGAFGGYFLLVIISLGFTYNSLRSSLNDKLEKSYEEIKILQSKLLREKSKYQAWKMTGIIESTSPEITKIFVDESNISINSVGKFTASLLIKTDRNKKAHLPSAICFFNKQEGYNVVDLDKKELVSVDTTSKKIEIKDRIRLYNY